MPVPTQEVLSGHGLDGPWPPEMKLRFDVYKMVAVSAGIVTAEEEEVQSLLAHVALALLRDLPLLQCYDTGSRMIDQEKTLSFHKTEPREESGIGIGPGPQELDSSADEGSGDAPAGLVSIRRLPARAEICTGARTASTTCRSRSSRRREPRSTGCLKRRPRRSRPEMPQPSPSADSWR